MPPSRAEVEASVARLLEALASIQRGQVERLRLLDERLAALAAAAAEREEKGRRAS